MGGMFVGLRPVVRRWPQESSRHARSSRSEWQAPAVTPLKPTVGNCQVERGTTGSARFDYFSKYYRPERPMLIRKPDDIKSSEITPEDAYLNRRKFLAAAGVAAAGIVGSGRLVSALAPARQQEDKPNTWEEITGYNNYYEFGTDKEDPRAERDKVQDEAVDGEGRRAGEEAGRLPVRGSRSSRTSSRTASTDSAASRRGRWSFRGRAFRSPR